MRPSTTVKKIVLASSSCYRRQLLEKLDLDFETASPNVNESAYATERPEQTCMRLARKKAHAIKLRFPKYLIIGADQIAMLGEKQLKKPGNRKSAIEQLEESSGRQVEFYSGVCVSDPQANRHETELDICKVQFRTLSSNEINNYVDRESPFDCAGAFKAEGLGIALLQRIISDDPNSLVGLPLIRLCRLLAKFGVSIL